MHRLGSKYKQLNGGNKTGSSLSRAQLLALQSSRWEMTHGACLLSNQALMYIYLQVPDNKGDWGEFLPVADGPQCLQCIGDASWRFSGVVRFQPVTAARTQITFSEQTQGSGFWLIDSWRHPIKLEVQQGYWELSQVLNTTISAHFMPF